ncbi:hypothetical protein ACFWZ4_03025 [Frateuria sp. GZRe12]|uniref:hypothetical protein n=1 Tax=Frateuria sp. GZRe12 TaxID=3351533 RepID=UPI003EDBDAFE
MTETPEPAMHIDESLPSSRPPSSDGSAHADIKPPVMAKGSAMHGGVPPMFASPDARPAPRGDAPEY